MTARSTKPKSSVMPQCAGSISGLVLGALVATSSALAEAPSRGFRYVDLFGEVHYVHWQPNRAWRPRPRADKRPPSRPADAVASERRPPARLTPLTYLPLIREAALVYQLPEALLYAVMIVESGFDAHAVSRKGAIGLMQLMPATALEMGVQDPYEPRQNVLGGARYLRVLTNQYDGDLVKTVAAYNAGPRAVNVHAGVPPFQETRRYVRRVLRNYYTYELRNTRRRLASLDR